MLHDFIFFCSPNPLQFILVPDIKVEKNGDDDNEDDLKEEEDVEENVSLPHTSGFFHCYCSFRNNRA